MASGPMSGASAARGSDDANPRPLLLGAESFPDRPGGLNRYFHDLLLALSVGEQPARGVVVGPASDPVPGITVVPPGRLLMRLWRYGRTARQLRASADVVDAHFALYAAAALLAGAARDRPFLVHFHGPWAAEGISMGERSRVTSAAKSITERLVYRRAAVAVTLTGSFKRLLVERYGIAPWRVAVVPPGIDLQRFAPGDRQHARRLVGLPDTGQVVLSVRRLVPRMGLDDLLRAWARLDAGNDARLLLVGDGPERARLERLAAELGVARTVLFRRQVGEEELVASYRAADVSVVPSTELEGFGLSVLESLACGTPVITSDAGGLSEATAGLHSRVITPAGDSERLAAALGRVLQGRLVTPTPHECRAHAERYSLGALGERHRKIHRRAACCIGSRKLRVVYIDHCARLSGAEIALLRIIQSLEGVDAHAILGEEGALEVQLREAGISTEVLPLAEVARDMNRARVRPGATGLAGPAVAALYGARLTRRLRRLHPDLVHVNTLKSGLYGAPAARLAGRPVVWHLHDRLSADYMPAFAARLVRAAMSRLADRVIANSQATRVTLNQAARCKASVISTPVDLTASPVEVHDQVRRVGIVGRLAPWKGQHVFLTAFARAFPSADVTATVIGGAVFGEDAYADSLRRHARQLGLEHRVTFTGHLDDVASALEGIDVLVHASTIPEPFGQAVLEGMAAGLPVVAPAAGGPAEVIRDGVNGVLYPPGDDVALERCLRRLASDKGLRASIGGAARDRARDFAPPVIAHQVIDVYRSALLRGSRTG